MNTRVRTYLWATTLCAAAVLASGLTAQGSHETNKGQAPQRLGARRVPAWAPPAPTPTYTILHTFAGGTDGSGPIADVLLDSLGNIYGTTYAGGVNSGGVIFTLDGAGHESLSYSFPMYATDGLTLYGGVVRDKAGNFYGTTEAGGPFTNNGIVFEVSAAGQETVLHAFTGGADGGVPWAGVILAGKYLYGTTTFGGTNNDGLVFKMSLTGKETVLHSFTGTDGNGPEGGLIRDSAGNLYGTCFSGGAGAGAGVVFSLDSKTGNSFSVLHTFAGYPTDGANPRGSLLRDSAGNLYGTTEYGGDANAGTSRGTVFVVTPSHRESMLYSFKEGLDGAVPVGNVVRDTAGNLYGTTSLAGAYNGGTVFKLDPSRNLFVLHAFAGAPMDGSDPYAGLVRDAHGNLYGTTYTGGTYGDGVIFKLKP